MVDSVSAVGDADDGEPTAGHVAPEAPGRPSADPCVEFLRQIYERVPDAQHLVPIEDLLDLARAALTERAAA